MAVGPWIAIVKKIWKYLNFTFRYGIATHIYIYKYELLADFNLAVASYTTKPPNLIPHQISCYTYIDIICMFLVDCIVRTSQLQCHFLMYVIVYYNTIFFRAFTSSIPLLPGVDIKRVRRVEPLYQGLAGIHWAMNRVVNMCSRCCTTMVLWQRKQGSQCICRLQQSCSCSKMPSQLSNVMFLQHDYTEFNTPNPYPLPIIIIA